MKINRKVFIIFVLAGLLLPDPSLLFASTKKIQPIVPSDQNVPVMSVVIKVVKDAPSAQVEAPATLAAPNSSCAITNTSSTVPMQDTLNARLLSLPADCFDMKVASVPVPAQVRIAAAPLPVSHYTIVVISLPRQSVSEIVLSSLPSGEAVPLLPLVVTGVMATMFIEQKQTRKKNKTEFLAARQVLTISQLQVFRC